MAIIKGDFSRTLWPTLPCRRIKTIVFFKGLRYLRRANSRPHPLAQDTNGLGAILPTCILSISAARTNCLFSHPAFRDVSLGRNDCSYDYRNHGQPPFVQTYGKGCRTNFTRWTTTKVHNYLKFLQPTVKCPSNTYSSPWHMAGPNGPTVIRGKSSGPQKRQSIFIK